MFDFDRLHLDFNCSGETVLSTDIFIVGREQGKGTDILLKWERHVSEGCYKKSSSSRAAHPIRDTATCIRRKTPHHANKVMHSWLGLPILSTTLSSSSLKGTEPSNNENNSSPKMEK